MLRYYSPEPTVTAVEKRHSRCGFSPPSSNLDYDRG
jgi:hypothetical protein